MGAFALTVLPFISTLFAVQFPSQRRLASPNGEWVIVNKDPVSTADEHTLWLERSSAGTRKQLYTYERHVTVFWSPDSKKICITDFEGSDSSRPYVFEIQHGTRVDIRERAATNSAELRRLLANHHAYVEGVGFLKGDRLLIRAHGYGDQPPEGFSRCYEVSLEGASVKSRKCPQG